MSNRGKPSATHGPGRKGLPWMILTFTCQMVLLVLDYLQFKNAKTKVKKHEVDSKQRLLHVSRTRRHRQIVEA